MFCLPAAASLQSPRKAGLLPGSSTLGCDNIVRYASLRSELEVLIQESIAVVTDRDVVGEEHDFTAGMGTGLLFFRGQRREAFACSVFLVQGKPLFGVGSRPRVGRAGTGGWVVWRPTPIIPAVRRGKCKRALLGHEERFQFAPAQRHLLRRGVQEQIAVGGRIPCFTHAGRNGNQTMIEENPQILFYRRPAQLELPGNRADAGVADAGLPVSVPGQDVIDGDADGADLLAVLVNNDIVHAVGMGAGLDLRDGCHTLCSPCCHTIRKREACGLG